MIVITILIMIVLMITMMMIMITILITIIMIIIRITITMIIILVMIIFYSYDDYNKRRQLIILPIMIISTITEINNVFTFLIAMTALLRGLINL